MKYAVAALVGAVSAAEVQIPTITWDKRRVDNIKDEADNYGRRAQRDGEYDDQESLKDLSHAYATYRVGEYVAFGKYMKPIAEHNVELMDELTVSGSCNQATATHCVNNWITQGMQPSQKPYMERCVKQTAGCNMHWDDLTRSEKEYLAREYDTDIQRLGRAYERVWAKTERELDAGW
jgi:hypothetical protein